jgi:hypothetical protein
VSVVAGATVGDVTGAIAGLIVVVVVGATWMVGVASLIVVVVVGATWMVGVASNGVVSVGVVVIALVGESSGVVSTGVVVIALVGESSGVVRVRGDSSGVLCTLLESAGATVVLGPPLSCSEERGPGGKGVGARPNTAPGGATSTGATPRAATNAV